MEYLETIFLKLMSRRGVNNKALICRMSWKAAVQIELSLQTNLFIRLQSEWQVNGWLSENRFLSQGGHIESRGTENFSFAPP